MNEITLYSTLGCHLCELALEQVEHCLDNDPAFSQRKITIKEVDIAEDLSLMEAYGTSIPVLFLAEADARLFWPFDSHNVNDFLKANNF